MNLKLETFLDDLYQLSGTNVFNPFSESCAHGDNALNSASLRKKLLRLTLEKAINEVSVEAIWIGRDMGHRGGRRTGLAFTDDYHAMPHIKRWGLDMGFKAKEWSPTDETKPMVREHSATYVWKILDQMPGRNILLWNLYPLHTHLPGKPLSNRQHTSAERKIGQEILKNLILMVKPNHLVAIGNDAYRPTKNCVKDLWHIVHHVRHPSYGGQNLFMKQMRNLYKLPAPQ